MARVTLRLPDHLHSRVRKLSHERGVSLNELIVDSLETTVALQATNDQEEDIRKTRIERLRASLGDLVVDVDISDFPVELYPNAQVMLDRDALFQSLPVLDPPLSRTVIEEREDRV